LTDASLSTGASQSQQRQPSLVPTASRSLIKSTFTNTLNLVGGFIAQFGLRLPYFIAGGIALLIAFVGFHFTVELKRFIEP
jgi:hypothetical protein